MNVLGWRAWYVVGAYTSADTSPEDLPEDGCLCVAVYTDLETPKRVMHSGEDTYFWWQSPEGLVIGCNSHSRADNERRYPGAVFVRGKWATYARMHDVQAAAQAAHAVP